MKRYFLILTILISGSISLFSQNKNEVYIIFTSSDTMQKGEVWRGHAIGSDITHFREMPLAFEFYFRERGSLVFWHFQSVKPKFQEKKIEEKDIHKVYTKPVSFLQEIDYYDWENLKGLSIIEWREFREKTLYPKMKDIYRFYLIDRRDIKDGKIKIYEVRDMDTPRF